MLAHEANVRRVLGLVDDPVVTLPFQFRREQRMDLPRAPLPEFRPRQLGEAVGDTLGRRRIAQFHEGIIDLLEGDAFLLQLPRDVVVALGVHLTSEGGARLQVPARRDA